MDETKYNWYPGHMKKALDEIATMISRCDCVFMVIDVRVYKSGYNKTLHKIIQEKRKQPIIILTRKDLIPKNYDLKRIESFYDQYHLPYYLLDIPNGKLQTLLNPVRISKKIINRKFVGTDFKPTILIVGLPNAGKSTYINALKQKASAKVANIPGITKRVSLFSIKNLATVIDTPGVLVPDALNEEMAYALHLVRAIKKSIIPISKSVFWALETLYVHSNFEYQKLAMKFDFKADFLLNKYTIESNLGPIKIEKLYTYLSGSYPFIWDY